MHRHQDFCLQKRPLQQVCVFLTKNNLKTWVLCLFQYCNNSEIFEKMNLCQTKMKIVLSDVSNYSNNKIIMFLYLKGIFYRTYYFQFAKPLISVKLNLQSTAMRFTVSEAVNFNRLHSLAFKVWRI
jgi:hypothetical protein